MYVDGKNAELYDNRMLPPPHCRQVYLLKNKARELNGTVTNRVGFNDELARFSENLFNPFGVDSTFRPNSPSFTRGY